MMDRLFDCLFYIDNVDLLGENCQPATDGFIMLHHNINMNYDMPASNTSTQFLVPYIIKT